MDVVPYKLKFLQYVNEIVDDELHQLAMRVFINLPRAFWLGPSSTTGKYHPPDERGIHGLVIHVFRAYRAAMLLADAESLSNLETDQVRFAVLFHDCTEVGLGDTPLTNSDKQHAYSGVAFIKEFFTEEIVKKGSETIYGALNCILSHNGRWGVEKPETHIEYIVHTADNLASKMHLILNEVNL